MAHKILVSEHVDPRGKLTVIDRVLPFEVKRVFYVYDVTDLRGGHRHHHCQQALIAMNGQVVVHCNNGIVKEDHVLSHPNQILIVPPEDWHTMQFSEGAILLVLASHTYDKQDYIYENYND